MSAPNEMKRFKLIGMAEGISFLLLLGVAMPLKYLAGEPLAVKLVGWAHGVLFMAYLAALGQVALRFGWPPLRIALGLIAALLPFGPFLFDGWLKREVPVRRGEPGAESSPQSLR